MIKQSVPHFFTSLNLLSGCFSIYFAYIFQFETTFIFLLAGVFFDIWDGLFARLFRVESDLGVQLDSMADMVTSGLTRNYFGPIVCVGWKPSTGNFYWLAN